MPKSTAPLAAIVVAAAAALLPSCGPSAAEKQQMSDQAQQLAQLQTQKSKLETQFKALQEEAQTKYNDVLQQNDDLQKSNDELRKTLEKVQDQIESTRREFEEYKAKYRVSVRSKAKGLQIPVLATGDGKTFESVVINAVSPSEVQFMHATGTARVPLANLPAEWQQKFAFDPNEEKEMKRREAEAEAAKTAVAAALTSTDKRKVRQGIDPIAINRLRERIEAREQALKKTYKEAEEVKKSPYGTSSLARLRLDVLQKRAARLKDEMIDLRNTLDKSLEH